MKNFKGKFLKYGIGAIIIIYILNWISIIPLLLFTVGFGDYDFKSAKVADVIDDKVIVEFYNHGDTKTYSINKPFLKSIRKNDYVEVRYNINNYNDMQILSVEDALIPLKINAFSTIIFMIIFMNIGLIYNIKEKKKRRRDERQKTTN